MNLVHLYFVVALGAALGMRIAFEVRGREIVDFALGMFRNPPKNVDLHAALYGVLWPAVCVNIIRRLL